VSDLWCDVKKVLDSGDASGYYCAPLDDVSRTATGSKQPPM
jgi:hypothetical protein